jgi:hypothetical protein
VGEALEAVGQRLDSIRSSAGEPDTLLGPADSRDKRTAGVAGQWKQRAGGHIRSAGGRFGYFIHRMLLERMSEVAREPRPGERNCAQHERGRRKRCERAFARALGF